ncbi:MAG: hypothetical protein WBV31_17460 [Terriglobales bacterium]|jgi:hypothetical protein
MSTKAPEIEVASVVQGLEFIAVKSVLAIGRDVEGHTRRCDENQYTQV